jgi:L,D-transpeptidase YcbB
MVPKFCQRTMSVGLLILGMGIGMGIPAEAGEDRIRDIIENLVAETKDSFQQELEEIYLPRQYEPIWVSFNGLNEKGQALVDVLDQADQQGLNPEDYDQSELQWLNRTVQLFSEDEEVFRANVLARFEVILSQNFLQFLDHATGGRISPEQVNGQWYLEDQRPPLTQILSNALEEGVTATVTSLAGAHDGFAPLLVALEQYRQIEADGGWPAIADGPLLAQGANSPRVEALRRRLAATGDLEAREDGSLFDQKVVEAVKRFQTRHGLPVDGLVGPETLKSLNVPVESRLQQLLVNLERRRWMPRTFGSEYIFVNIPDFGLTAYRNNEPHLRMPVIVGKPMNQTPIFSDTLEYIVFNPYWYVPRSIAKEEILPEVQEDPDYLEKKNYELIDEDEQLLNKDVKDIFSVENIENFTVRIRQKPGPANALGLVKFMFPNDHAIYLHDTPADQLFEASERDFSHGCIRVERPTELAEFLLNGKWTREDILRALERSERQKIHLPQAIPVAIVYLTAWMDEEGTLQFREDPYGHDEQLWSALHPKLADAVQVHSGSRSSGEIREL